jgi:hypothetical protein
VTPSTCWLEGRDSLLSSLRDADRAATTKQDECEHTR